MWQHKKAMKHSGLLFGLIGVLLNFHISTAQAQLAVIDAASIAQLGEELTELENHLIELKKHTTSLEHSVSTFDGTYQWSTNEMLNLMTDLNKKMQEYSHIAYSASNLDSQFKTYYPGFTAYDAQGQLINSGQLYQANVDDTLRTMNGSLQTIGMNMGDFSTENSRMEAIQQHTQDAQGQTQVLQAMSEASGELASQTQKLRQIVSAQANAQIAYQAEQVQKEATADAELQEVLSKGMTQAPEYASNPDDCF